MFVEEITKNISDDRKHSFTDPRISINPSRINIKKHFYTHIIVRLLKAVEKTLRVATEKWLHIGNDNISNG